MIKKLFARLLIAMSTISFAMCASASPTLLVNASGVLTGADNVNLSGRLYDVTFTDGSCNSLFNGCTVFQFSNYGDSDIAGQALLDQVLIDGPAGMFASKPGLTSGCTDIIRCFIFIPNVFSAQYNYAYGTAVFNTFNDPLFERGLGTFGAPPDNDTGGQESYYTYAVFKVSAVQADVPEPNSIALCLLAMGGIVFVRRKN